MGETISRPCGREDCGGAFLTTLYDPRRFCSDRCENKVKAAAQEARGERRKQRTTATAAASEGTGQDDA